MGTTASIESPSQIEEKLPYESSKSDAILFAHRFSQCHPLFRWKDDENIIQHMGNRSTKYTFLVDLSDLSGNTCSRVVLTVLPMNTNSLKHSQNQTTYRLKALLVSLRNANLVSVLDVEYYAKNDSSSAGSMLLIAQSYNPSGSLKDLIYRQRNPCKSYRIKYPKHTQGTRLPRAQVSRFARQILEGLIALRSVGIICDHLKTSNVIVDQGVAKISDVFNTILCLERDPDIHERTKPLESFVAVDLLLFGHVLFEMAFGYELDGVVPTEKEFASASLDVADVLRLIFVTFPATIDAVIKMPLFAAHLVPTSPSIQLDQNMLSAIRSSMQINEKRRQAHVTGFIESDLAKRSNDSNEEAVLPPPTQPRKSNGMGITWGKLSYREKQELWGASLLSPLFVEDDLETLSTLSIGHNILPGFPLINHKCKVALCYEGELSAVIPKIGTVIFKIGPQKQYLGLKRLSTAAGFSISRAFHKSMLENDNKFVIDTEEMLVSVYASDDKLALAKEFLLRFVVNRLNGNEVIIKSFRAVSIQVIKRAKVVALERHSSKYEAHNAGVYYLLNNVLNSDSMTLLRSVSFFADLSDEKLVRLADLSTISVLAPDVVIFKENDEEGSEMFIILAGSLEVTVQAKEPGDQPLVLATLHAGSCFGEMALMTRVPRAATVTVVENAMLLSIERNAFVDFLADNKDVKEKLTRLLQERLMKKALTSNIVPFFSAIEYDLIMELSRSFVTEDNYVAGDVIVTPETYTSKFSIVICGTVDVLDTDEQGESKMTSSLGPGSYFGQFGVLSVAKSVRHSIVAKSKCVLFSCPQEAITKIIGTSVIETAEMFIRWMRENCDVKHVMQHPKARNFLVEFCKSEFSDENVLFLMDVELYCTMTQVTQRRKKARELVETYIQGNALKQVNIDHHMRESILSNMAMLESNGIGEAEEMEIELTMFETARREIMRLVTKDNFPRFKKAPQFQAMMDAFAPYAHAKHISSHDAQSQFKENIVLSPRNRNTADLMFQFVKILETVNLHKTRRTTRLNAGEKKELMRKPSSKIAIDR